MSKTRVAGFTIIEILIVIVIITIMVGAGGFYYRDLQRQTISRKAFEDAANLANIINDIYNTGHFGTSSDSLAGLNVKKGTYPDTNKAVLTKDRLVKAYGGQFKKQNILIADSAKFYIKPGVSPMSHNVLDGQTNLENNASKIIYAPIKTEVLPGKESALCSGFYAPGGLASDYEYACNMAVIYAVAYHAGKYQLRPVKIVKSGVVYDFQE